MNVAWNPALSASQQLASLFETASAHRRAGRNDEAERGYLQVIARDSGHRDAWNSLGMLYLDLERYQDAEHILWHASCKFPNDAGIINDLGVLFYRQGKLEKAKEKYEEALRIKPRYDIALANLGRVLRDCHQLDDAAAKFKKALSINPDNVDTLIDYGLTLEAQGQHDEAARKYNKVLAIDPRHATALNNKGNLKLIAGHLEEALGYIDQALDIHPRHGQALWNKAVILLALGRYREGFELYESGKGKKGLRGFYPFASFASRQWDGSPLPDKRLLILAEQGLGDSLQFIRYAALCKERVGKVIVICEKPLVRLFKNCPFIDEVFDTSHSCAHDAYIVMMSLPHVFGTTLDTVPAKVPYLFADPRMAEKWAGKMADKDEIRVGLVWSGDGISGFEPTKLYRQRRSIDLRKCLPLFDLPNIALCNLQKGAAAKQIEELGLQNRITDYMNDVDDFMDTGALIQNLDLVITVDTSVAHLAGGLGKPVWVLSRYDACWRWLQNREDSPWYPTARVFGQPSPGDWDSVIQRVCAELNAL
jgi:tetratricopeptide (TPR) repeat protein